MALSFRRSILMNFRFLPGLLFFGVLAVPAWAQRPIPRVPTPAPVPPMVHTPMYRPPVYQAPIYRAPVYAPIAMPGMSVMPGLRTPVTAPYRTLPLMRPFPLYRIYFFPVFSYPFWNYNFCWWAICDQYWTSTLIYNTIPNDQWNPANFIPPTPAAPLYVYGVAREDTPELILKDGTILNVTDYWVVDNQLHFKLMEKARTKPTEQVVPFDELDLQQTIDADTQLGFRFVLRNEPVEQYLRDHPEGPPPPLTPLR